MHHFSAVITLQPSAVLIHTSIINKMIVLVKPSWTCGKTVLLNIQHLNTDDNSMYNLSTLEKSQVRTEYHNIAVL